jgi:hypothetical protein
MPTYANVTPAALVDGQAYSTSVALTSTEADLFNQSSGPDPVPVKYGEAVIAVVTFLTVSSPVSNTTYVVMQTDLNGDGTWIDVAWVVWTGLTTATFVLAAGVAGADAFQQSRASGTAPASSGSKQIPLGGRIRFVGKSTVGATNQSSSSAGQPATGVRASITYKLLGLR